MRLFALCLGLAACGKEPEAQYCTNLFEAIVREGPNAGLAVTGLLILPVPDAQGAFSGQLYPAGADGAYEDAPLTVSGEATDTTLSLTLTTASGQVLQGTGPIDAPMDSCPEPIEGTLTGPEAGDVGDWGGTCCGNSLCSGTDGIDGSCGSIRCGGCAL